MAIKTYNMDAQPSNRAGVTLMFPNTSDDATIGTLAVFALDNAELRARNEKGQPMGEVSAGDIRKRNALADKCGAGGTIALESTEVTLLERCFTALLAGSYLQSVIRAFDGAEIKEAAE